MLSGELVKFIVLVTAITVLLGIVLWNNASDFDWTEIKAMIEFVVAIVIGRGGLAMLASRVGGHNGENK